MEKIGLWCKAISIISVITSVIMMLLSESKSKKTFRVLVSLIILYVIINPFSDFEPDFSIYNFLSDDYNISAFEEKIEYYESLPLITAAESETEKYINDVLKKFDENGTCKVKCDYSNEKVLIKEIVITGNFTNERKAMIKKEVEKICSKDTMIIFSGADYE